MSRRSRSAGAARNQPDLFSFAGPPEGPRAANDAAVKEPEVIAKPASAPRPVEMLEAPPKKPAVTRKPREVVEPRPGHLLDVRSAAAWLGLSKSTLDKMRCYGVGPKFIRASGKPVRYDPADLKAFAEERRQSRTSDQIAAQ